MATKSSDREREREPHTGTAASKTREIIKIIIINKDKDKDKARGNGAIFRLSCGAAGSALPIPRNYDEDDGYTRAQRPRPTHGHSVANGRQPGEEKKKAAGITRRERFVAADGMCACARARGIVGRGKSKF